MPWEFLQNILGGLFIPSWVIDSAKRWFCSSLGIFQNVRSLVLVGWYICISVFFIFCFSSFLFFYLSVCLFRFCLFPLSWAWCGKQYRKKVSCINQGKKGNESVEKGNNFLWAETFVRPLSSRSLKLCQHRIGSLRLLARISHAKSMNTRSHLFFGAENNEQNNEFKAGPSSYSSPSSSYSSPSSYTREGKIKKGKKEEEKLSA